MKLSKNFTVEEFLSNRFLAKVRSKNQDPKRYINMRLVEAAEFVREFLNNYYQNLNPDIVEVKMIGNKAGVQTRGLRTEWDTTSGAELSDHKFGNAFDSDIIFVYKNGTQKEADYSEIVNLILEYQKDFLDAGITMVEDSTVAKTWLHFSIAYTGKGNIVLVK